ncbi:cupin domain-containing protein [Streptomyces sp. NPDC005122]
MAYIGKLLRQGSTDRMVFRKTARDTNGAYIEVEVMYASMVGIEPPPVHYHPFQHENFQVLEGCLGFHIDGAIKSLHAGEEIELGSKVNHTVWNSGEEPARFIWRTTPAQRTETLFETMWGLIDDGVIGRHGTVNPPLLQSVALMYEYRREYRRPTPPYPIALPLLALLTPIARAAGYRGRYERYSKDGDRTKLIAEITDDLQSRTDSGAID